MMTTSPLDISAFGHWAQWTEPVSLPGYVIFRMTPGGPLAYHACDSLEYLERTPVVMSQAVRQVTGFDGAPHSHWWLPASKASDFAVLMLGGRVLRGLPANRPSPEMAASFVSVVTKPPIANTPGEPTRIVKGPRWKSSERRAWSDAGGIAWGHVDDDILTRAILAVELAESVDQ